MITGELDGFLNGMWKVVHDSGELASAVTTYAISGLSGDTDIEYMLLVRMVDTANSGGTYLRFNSDSGANYGYQYLYGSDTSALAFRATGQTVINVCGTNVANQVAFASVHIFAKSGKERTALVTSCNRVATTSVGYVQKLAYSWNNTADEIISLNLHSATSFFNVGSRFILLKKTHATDGVETGELLPANLPGVWERISEIELSTIETSQTKLLATFQGADGATTGTAETGQTITFAGTAQLDDAQAKIGKTSLLLDGNSDYVTVPDSDDWYFGTGNFTIDFWINFTNLSQANFMFAQRQDANNHHSFYVSDVGVITYYCRTGSTDRALYSRTTPVFTQTGAWYHVALVRQGALVKLYVNGTNYSMTESTAAGDFGNIAGAFTIGANGAATAFCSAYIDAFRITKGKALWLEDFTPPTTYGCANAVVIGDLAGDTDVVYKAICKAIGTSSTTTYYGVRPNDDSGSNYGNQKLEGQDAVVSAARTVDAYCVLGFVGGSAGHICLSEFLLYAKSGYVRTMLSSAVSDVSGTLPVEIRITGTSWNNTSDEIRSITFFSTVAAHLGVGTSVELYKLNL